MANLKYYVVFVGREPGIYESWEDVEAQVSNFEGGLYKEYQTLCRALNADMLYHEAWQRMDINVSGVPIRGPEDTARSVEEAMKYVNQKLGLLDALGALLDGYVRMPDVEENLLPTTTVEDGVPAEICSGGDGVERVNHVDDCGTDDSRPRSSANN